MRMGDRAVSSYAHPALGVQGGPPGSRSGGGPPRRPGHRRHGSVAAVAGRGGQALDLEGQRDALTRLHTHMHTLAVTPRITN